MKKPLLDEHLRHEALHRGDRQSHAEERHLAFEGNARRVFSRLDARLKQGGP